MSSTARGARAHDPLINDLPGHVDCLLGNEAVVRGAIEAGVGFACGYPGTPSSEITDGFARVAAAREIVFEYSINEKICLEMAFAASLAGARSLCAMKHLGLMVAGDPLSTIPYVGVRAGMVIVSAGDPSCHTSPNEQDQRHLGPMLHLPVLDPATPQEACDLTRMAFDLSERSSLPVLLRITTRVAHTRAMVRSGPVAPRQPTGFVRDPSRWTPIPVNARRMRTEIGGRLQAAGDWIREQGLLRREGGGRDAILATGAPAATCADLIDDLDASGAVTLFSMPAVHPLPEQELIRMLEEFDRILVVEELSPFLEDALAAIAARSSGAGRQAQILGKHTGHLPTPFEYVPAVLQAGLHGALGLGAAPTSVPDYSPVPPRPPSLCPGCPHRSSYFAAKLAFGEEQLYFNDIGCYTLGYGPPLNTVDALLSMGAGFTLAAGVARVTGQRTVGFMGDSTFFHSGMPALLDAIKEDVNMVAVILDNQITAMTGFQESPTVEMVGDNPERRVSIEGVVRALGADHVEKIDPSNLAASVTAFERARDHEGLSVIIAEEPCPVHLIRETGHTRGIGAFEIDHERCQHCGREDCGQRCEQCTTHGLETQMARARVQRNDPEGGRWQVQVEMISGERHEGRMQVAPCATRCPLSICVQGYTGHVAAGQFSEALELIMSRCPLPDSVCRVCHRPCEPVCVHADVGEPVAINDLKRFVMEWAAEQPEPPYSPELEPDHSHHIAVVGAGPAGLAASHDLRLRGYRVTLFDAAEAPGGLLRTGIPPFRLPRESLERDVARILAMGVDFRGGARLGRDLQLEGLVEEHDAVFVALGAHSATELSMPGAGEPGAPPAIDALEYLDRVLAGDETAPRGERVAVIGGGNAALDAARVALRRGADSVQVVYRRRQHEMPALADEIEAALAEGVEIVEQVQPVRMASGCLGCVRTQPGELDSSGRARAEVVPGSELEIAADLVIIAAGQNPDVAAMSASDLGIECSDDGSVLVDCETCRTSHRRVFAGGDQVHGDRTVTAAIAFGQRAAWGIDCALRGREAADIRPPPVTPGGLILEDSGGWPGGGSRHSRFAWSKRLARRIPPTLAREDRLTGFDEVHGCLTEKEARDEAARCQACGECANCRACIDLFACPAFYEDGGRIHIDAKLCTGCALCAEFCPDGAIRVKSSES